MILIDNFNQVLLQLENERGVSREVLIDTVKQAIISACKRKFEDTDNLDVDIDIETGEMRVVANKVVVEAVTNPMREISMAELGEYAADIALGDVVKLEVTPESFGRLAAQTAKQVIVQRIREAEKDGIFGEFKSKEGTVIVGTIQKHEGRHYLVNLGRIEAILPPSEQIPNEEFTVKQVVKIYVIECKQTPKGPLIHVSRTHPGLLRYLFSQEVPEIADNVIQIMGVARDPGKRAKVAVKSNDSSVGAVGTCVGHMGQRIQAIMREIHNERIDIIEWSDNAKTYINNSLKPAKLSNVVVISEEDREAIVVVAEDQLSLAIGRSGQNVRLASRLTGWRIDILSEAEYAEKSNDINSIRKDSLVERMEREKEQLRKDEAGSSEIKAQASDAEPVLAEAQTVVEENT